MSDVLTQLRSFRLGGFALFDFAAAVYGTGYLAEQFGYTREEGYLAAVPLGVAVHWLLGVRTPLNSMLLGGPVPNLAPPLARSAMPFTAADL